MEKILKYCYFLLFSFVLPLHAQQFSYRNYTSEVGLESGVARAIVKDTSGFVFIGTDNGIYRYDGLRFENFKEGLPSLLVKGLIRTQKGKIYAATDGGVVEVISQPKSVTFKPLLPPPTNSSKDSLLVLPRLMYEDSKGDLYISDNYGLLKYKNGKTKKYNLRREKVSNSNWHSVALYEDNLGLIALTEVGDCFRLDRKIDDFVKIDLPTPLNNINYAIKIDQNTGVIASREGLSVLTFDNIGRVANLSLIPNTAELDASRFWKQDKNTIYIGSWTSGLYRMKIQNGQYNISKVEEYKLKNINAFYTENGREIWLASDEGTASLSAYYFRKDLEKFAATEIRSLGESPEGEVYFTDGDFLYQVKEDAGNFSAEIVYASQGTLILQVYPTSEGVWFSDSEGNISLCKDGIISKTFSLAQYGKGGFSLAVDMQNSVWVLQEESPNAPEYQPGILCIKSDGTIRHFGRKEGVSARLTCVKVLTKGEIVCGGSTTDRLCLLKFDASKQLFIPFAIEKNLFEKNEKLLEINDITQSNNGALWLATTLGLLKYQAKKIEKLNVGEVTNPSIQSVFLDAKGQVWFAYEKGLAIYQPEGCIVFDEKAGLAEKKVGYARLLIDSRNRIWVGTNKGLNFTPTYQIIDQNTTPCLVNIEYDGAEADVNNMSFGFGKFLKLFFIAPSVNTSGTRYEYRIVGKDSTWKKMASNYVILNGLEGGEHILEVRAIQSGNYTWSKPLRVAFKVYRFWYQKPWLLTLLGIALICGTIGIFRLYAWRLNARSRELENMVQERTLEVTRQNSLIEERNNKLQQVNVELGLAKQKAEEAASAKAQFLSSITHEIRTPLNGVIGITNSLIESDPRPDQMENLNILEFSAKNLLSLVNDVLDFNKLDANRMELEMIPFDVYLLLENIIKTFKYTIQAKGIGLELKMGENVPQMITGDPLRLNQVLTNLIGNAIKFTQQGGVVLQVICDKREDRKATLTFEVHDTGIGIPEDRVDKIFQGFTQASADISRRFGGTGLGLAISNKILKLQNSQLQVHSVFGKGSTFFFTIEVEIPEPKQEETTPIHVETKDALKGKKILLCEDNEINVMITTNMLKKWGVVYEVAENGKQAVSWVEKQDFDIILMDLNMPEMDGFEAVTVIRAMDNPKYQQVPIIAFSAASEGGRDEQAYAVGMNDFIIKPFKPDELYEKMKMLLEL
ncbi:MAG: response regulator [Bacteroidia bacterium]